MSKVNPFSIVAGGKDVGAGGVNHVGSKAWATKVRNRAKELAGSLDTGYMEMAELLYTVYDRFLDGDVSEKPLYSVWGYQTFAEYAEKELGLQKRKAERLRAIWYRISVELKALPEELRTRIVALGWSKVRELIRVLTLKNAKKWVEQAEQLNHQQLSNSIQKYLVEKQKSETKQHIEGGKLHEPDPAAMAEPLPYPVYQFPKQVQPAPTETPASVTEPVVQAVKAPAPQPPPEPTPALEEDDELPPQPDALTQRQFTLYPDQADIVQQALERSAEISESQKPSHNLTLICTEFLATNDFTTASRKQQLKFLANLEKSMGVKLIVLDKEFDLIYGNLNLNGLIDKVQKEQEAEEIAADAESDDAVPEELSFDDDTPDGPAIHDGVYDDEEEETV